MRIIVYIYLFDTHNYSVRWALLLPFADVETEQ